MKIYDDILDNQFLDYINRTILRMNWKPHVSSSNQVTPLFFNSVTIDQNIQRNEYNEYCFLFDIIVSIIEKEPEIKGKKISLDRGYVNLYPYGIGGDWHTDTDSKNGRTVLFYPSDWKKEYGGATEFQESGEKVEYKKNRLLIFNSHTSHRAAVHQNPKNRYTIAFKIFILDAWPGAKQVKAADALQ